MCWLNTFAKHSCTTEFDTIFDAVFEFLNEYLHVGIVLSISGIVLMRLSLLYLPFSTGCLQQAETIPAEPAPDNAGEGIEL